MTSANAINKIPLIVVIVYLVLVMLSIIPIFTGDDALSGIFAIILTAPWSALLGNLLPGAMFDNPAAGLLLLLIGAAINAAVLYFVVRWLVRRFVV
ncbi:MAG: hypothetical protein H6631_09605 [Anaerolineaceae bacterium]|nr:hypothetical protein [Anaerolineaceae bacterium]MCB9100718.1 hypothetical protein [Anaerolineales bacterium]